MFREEGVKEKLEGLTFDGACSAKAREDLAVESEVFWGRLTGETDISQCHLFMIYR